MRSWQRDARGPPPHPATISTNSPTPRMILTEALRLYPPAWLMTRRNLGGVSDLGEYLLASARTFILS